MTKSPVQNASPRRLSVSVVIPTYNRADYLPAAIESALNQTRTPLEVIVIDDGSVDDTQQILSRYGSRVISRHQANAGVSAARNHGIRVASGEAIIFLDSDDLLMPECIERLVEVLENDSQVDIVYPEGYLVDGETKRLGLLSKLMPGERPSGMVLAALGSWCFLQMSATIVRTSALQDDRFDEKLHGVEDYEFWCRLATRCRFAYVDEPLLCYRYHESQTIAKQFVRIFEDGLEVQRRVMAMPQFQDLGGGQRAQVFCSYGAKNAMLGHCSEARRMFWRAIRTAPWKPSGYVLTALGLLGRRPLQYAILKRRQFVGNQIAAVEGKKLVAPARPDRASRKVRDQQREPVSNA